EALTAAGNEADACHVLDYFSNTELRRGLDLVIALSASIEARLKTSGALRPDAPLKGLPQVW
ncbi:MAG: hypothetical protein V2I51_07765, partial [Anderseniella sp.]|nr:hypothetical protein [Anderseniella sp.]